MVDTKFHIKYSKLYRMCKLFQYLLAVNCRLPAAIVKSSWLYFTLTCLHAFACIYCKEKKIRYSICSKFLLSSFLGPSIPSHSANPTDNGPSHLPYLSQFFYLWISGTCSPILPGRGDVGSWDGTKRYDGKKTTWYSSLYLFHSKSIVQTLSELLIESILLVNLLYGIFFFTAWSFFHSWPWYRNKGTQSGTGIFRQRTGMPKCRCQRHQPCCRCFLLIISLFEGAPLL